MSLKNVSKHAEMAIHKRHSKERKDSHPKTPFISPETVHQSLSSCAASNWDFSPAIAMDIDDTTPISEESTPVEPDPKLVPIDDTIPASDSQQGTPTESDPELVPIVELWDSSSCPYQLGDAPDLFEELQSALASRECFFPMPLAPVNDEIGSDDCDDVDAESNFGIEFPGKPLLFSQVESIFFSTIR